MVQTRRKKAAAAQDGGAVKENKAEPPVPQAMTTPTKKGRRGRPPKIKTDTNTPSTSGPTDVSNLEPNGEVRHLKVNVEFDSQESSESILTNEAESFLEKEEDGEPASSLEKTIKKEIKCGETPKASPIPPPPPHSKKRPINDIRVKQEPLEVEPEPDPGVNGECGPSKAQSPFPSQSDEPRPSSVEPEPMETEENPEPEADSSSINDVTIKNEDEEVNKVIKTEPPADPKPESRFSSVKRVSPPDADEPNESIPDSESMDIADSESEGGVEVVEDTTLTQEEIHVEVEQEYQPGMASWPPRNPQPPAENHLLSSPTVSRPKIHFLHPAYESFASEPSLVSPQPPVPSEPKASTGSSTENGFTMGFKPMAFKSGKMGLKSNPLARLSSSADSRQAATNPPIPGASSDAPESAATPIPAASSSTSADQPSKRSSQFGAATTSNVLPPPQMVELPKLSFFNMPPANLPTSSIFQEDDSSPDEHQQTRSRSRRSMTPISTPIPPKVSDAAIETAKAKAEKVAQEIARRHNEDREREMQEEVERRREERERRHQKKAEEERERQENTRRQRDDDDRRAREKEREITKRHEREERERQREEERQRETDRRQKDEENKQREEEKKKEKVMKEEDMKVPEYEIISESKYLTRNANKKKTESLSCECYVTGGNCSDNTCVNRAMLTECPSSCPAKCKNQRFAKRKYASVEAFHTGTPKGCGLRALKDIKKGRFIIEYVGEVVERDDYEKRKMKYAADKKHKHHYLCDTGIYTIDATTYGNPSRFVNHSCDPNAICEKWSVPRTPGDVNRVGFFAKKNISAGEEITFDYQFVNYGRDAQQCFCGTSKCTGWIGQKPEEYSSDEDDNEDLVTTRYINMDEEEERKLEELEELGPCDRIDLIYEMLEDLVIRNKKHARKVITIAAKMTDHEQRERLIQEIFCTDTAMGTQAYYAKEGMTTLMGEWLEADDYSLANLRLVQTTLQALHGDAFIAVARSDRFLQEVVSRWRGAAPPEECIDVHIVADSLVTCVVEQKREYAEVSEATRNEIMINFARCKGMALLLSNFWFNRSVSFKIPKKIREPEPKEQSKEQQSTSSSGPTFLRESSHSHETSRGHASPPYQRQHHSSSYYDQRDGQHTPHVPRFFNNGNDVHQYRFTGYHGNNYKANYHRAVHHRNSHYRERRRFARRSRSPRSRSPSPQLYKRRKLEERENRNRSPPYERRPQTPPTPVSDGSNRERSCARSESKINAMSNSSSSSVHHATASDTARLPTTPQTAYPTAEAPSAAPAVPAVPTGPYPLPPGYEAYGIYDAATGMYMYHPPPAGYYPPYPHHAHILSMETLPTVERLEELYGRATLDQLNDRLQRAQQDVDSIQRHIVRKREEMAAIEAARIRTEEMIRRQETAAPREKYVWAVAKAENGDVYYYNKETKETQWSPPRAEQGLLDPNDRTSPDTTTSNAAAAAATKIAEETPQKHQTVEYEKHSKEEEHRPQLHQPTESHHRSSHHRSEHRGRDRERRDDSRHRDHHHRSDDRSRGEDRVREFKKEIERIITPVVKSYIRNVRDASHDKTSWLIKMIVKELYKRESAQSGFDHRVTDHTEKKVRNYTKSLIDRKIKNDDLWKGYADR